jgi:ubiquinone/menaquinone biosynthesis C-methylase UbiE
MKAEQSHFRPADREYFDELAREAGEFNPFTDRGWRTLEASFSAMFGALGDSRMLDVGCGTGRSRQIYASTVSEYIGLDLSLESVRIAAREIPELSFVQGDAVRLPFADDSFDLVAFSSVLHHIPDRRGALREAGRVLRPGGAVFAFDPNLLHPAMALFRCPSSPLYSSAGVSPTEKPLLPATLRSDFRSTGFNHIRQRCQADIPYRALAPRLLNAFLPVYNAADRLMAISGLGRWFGTFVLTAGTKARGEPAGLG